MDLDEAVPYRLAFTLADQLREADDPNHPSRLRSNPAAGGSVETILAEVGYRVRVEGKQEREIVREACEDALTVRRPRS